METIYVQNNLQPTIKLERFSLIDGDAEVIDIATTTIERAKIGEIFLLTRNHLAFVCTHCLAEFPLFIQFASHIEIHLQEVYGKGFNPTTIKLPPEKSDLDHVNIKLLNISDHTTDDAVKLVPEVITNRIDTELINANKQQNNKFDCSECKRTFSLQTDLNYHRFTDSCLPTQSFCCHICDAQFSRNFALSQHLRNIHFINVRLSRARSSNFECPICERNFKVLKRLKTHLGRHSSDEQFRCKICSVAYAGPNVYIRHVTESHSENKKNQTVPSRANKFELRKRNQIPKMDSLDDSESKIEDKIDNNISSSDNNIALNESPSAPVAATEISANDKIIEIKSFECFQCHKQYQTRIDCEAHIRNHLPVTTRCAHCTRSIRTMDALLHHQKYCKPSTEATPTKCPVCNQTFASHRHYYVHAREDHRLTKYQINSFKKTTCKRCAKDFKTRSEYAKHMETHNTREKYNDEHKCDLCDKTYKGYYNLINHKKRHAGDRLWKCDLCNKSYDILYKKDHMRTHTGERRHQCSECGKLFFNMFRLNRHMLTHTGALPYKCDHCDRAFRQKSFLIDHVKQHADKYVYSCKICVKSYANKYIMIKHYRKFHGLNESDVEQLNLNVQQQPMED